MKKVVFLIITLSVMFTDAFAQTQPKEVSGVYVGGHIRRQRPGTITTLRNSGFTYAILFNVHVDADGTLKTDGETICKNGKYVFNQTQPYYQEDVRNLKTAPTGITRIEICIGGWGNDSYDHIRDLINSKGTGRNTMLYQNFKALIEAVPEIDAVNNDDEHCYDVTTAAKFHVMMYDLGYKTTLAPYTYMSFWTSLCSEIRKSRLKAVDRIMVQCYDGGAGNVNIVGSWNFPGVQTRHAGLMYYSNDWSLEKNTAQFEKWRDDGVASGGFVWVYNDESWNLNAWAAAINRTYGAVTVPESEVVARFYSEKNYGGYCVGLAPGTYHQADLAVHGIAANDIASLELVDESYQIKLYLRNDCKGSYVRYRTTPKALSNTYLDKVCSIVIEPNPTGIEGIAEEQGEESIYKQGSTIVNLAGQRLTKAQRGVNIINGRKTIK